MDYMAVVSMGAFPTPTPSDSTRASLAASWGLLETSPSVSVVLNIIFGTMPFVKPLLIPAERPGTIPGVNENNNWLTS